MGQTTLNYTGQRLDSTGLLFYNARYYDPVLGRFISADTIVPGADALSMTATGRGGGAANPQSLNRYSYVNNNPVNKTDPSGHCIEDFCIGEAIVAAAIWAGSTPEGQEVIAETSTAAEATLEQAGEALSGAAEAVTAEVESITAKATQATTTGEEVLSEGIVYRGGSAQIKNLTPRPVEDIKTGLSTFKALEQAAKPGDKAQMIDISKLKTLVAHFDNDPPGHVSLRPSNVSEIGEWASTREGAIAHRYTDEIIKAIVGVAKRPK